MPVACRLSSLNWRRLSFRGRYHRYRDANAYRGCVCIHFEPTLVVCELRRQSLLGRASNFLCFQSEPVGLKVASESLEVELGAIERAPRGYCRRVLRFAGIRVRQSWRIEIRISRKPNVVGTKTVHYSPVEPIHLIIGLWMVGFRERNVQVTYFEDALEIYRNALTIVVDYKVYKRAVREYTTLSKHYLDFYCGEN